MKRLIVKSALLAIACGALVTGCRGEVEVDPDGRVSAPLVTPR